MSTNAEVIFHPLQSLLYVIIGLGTLGIWALGTSVQVLTSEAWMMHESMSQIDFSAFGQLWQALRGQLLPEMYVPFIFGWGVQFALIVASVGIELPRHPAWRFYLAWIVVIFLIGVNSCGDFVSSSQYGIWGQCGFTLVVFFVIMILTILQLSISRYWVYYD